MKKALIFISLFLSFAFGRGEPSAFGAGDLESPEPYGLTQSEKYILQNKKAIQKLQSSQSRLQMKIQEIEEKVEGVKSIVEGIDQNLNSLKVKLEEFSENESKKQKEIENLKERITVIEDDLNKTITLQNENYNQIKTVLKELTSLIDSINTSYVSKEEFKSELEKLNQDYKKRLARVEKEIKKELKKRKIAKKDNATLFKEAKKLYREKKYDTAREYFETLIKNAYKPATSNFYIGEICYYQKKYECAIEHYKKSASLYSKSSFMPTLLLHTAISLERIGEKDKAKTFYQNLIENFPDSKAAKIAKKNLQKIK
ncbi:tetratricopeptide repeat protein [Nitrosophilus alvini]|uniref:tetratricopeptide repeat protein n=1 Tax=Nitrosophilus alvini TaxID=2714855 RepID=UPI00190B03CF|nr:tetratricopeptide repeat protein [Nitrosophilus alvini]